VPRLVRALPLVGFAIAITVVGLAFAILWALADVREDGREA
jgi:hypothetical protein